ncbi:VHL beta domain-containing protein [Nostoc sp.]|uniref:VHL beta domain-containing protein n=1 Tax=Nostoc sp. TaxID=1180 RepID=UPI002FFCC8A4
MVTTSATSQISITYGTDGTKIVSGRTQRGATNWQQHKDDQVPLSIYVEIDTSAAGFAETPIYVTSIAGDKHHYGTTGASSVYKSSPTGFRIQIRWERGYVESTPKPKIEELTPEWANSRNWYINWMAIEPSPPIGANELPKLGCENEKSLRSVEGGAVSEINFINKTSSVVKVVWIDHQGQRKFYRDLKPGESYIQSTYVNHPWVVTDEKGGCLGLFLQSERDRKDAIIKK